MFYFNSYFKIYLRKYKSLVNFSNEIIIWTIININRSGVCNLTWKKSWRQFDLYRRNGSGNIKIKFQNWSENKYKFDYRRRVPLCNPTGRSLNLSRSHSLAIFFGVPSTLKVFPNV